MKRMNGVTAVFLSLAFLLSLANTVLVFFAHIPANARLLPRTYFQAYGVPELLLAAMGVVITSLVAFLLYRQSGSHQLKAGGLPGVSRLQPWLSASSVYWLCPVTCSWWGSSS